MRPVLLLVVALMLTGTALASDDVIAQRSAIMMKNYKAANIANSSILGKFMPDKVAAALEGVVDNMAVFLTLFPPGSETGGQTKAGPMIWSERQSFETQASDFIALVHAAEASLTEGQDAFALAWQPVAEGCHACHVKYTIDPGQI